MIPDEAVEAVAAILAEAACADIDREAGFSDGDNLTPDDYAIFMPSARENARTILEAAAPYMLLPNMQVFDGEKWVGQITDRPTL